MSAIMLEFLTLLIMAFALGMDAFSIGLGMGMYRLRYKQIFKIGLTVGFFHIWMPLVGMLAGKFLSEKFGTVALIIGGLMLILLGLHMVWSCLKKTEEKIISPSGFGLLLFAFSVSVDSLSIGLTLGIYHAKMIMVVLCFGIVATVLTWCGLLVGRKVQGWAGVYGEALGGSILLAFGLKLLFSL